MFCHLWCIAQEKNVPLKMARLPPVMPRPPSLRGLIILGLLREVPGSSLRGLITGLASHGLQGAVYEAEHLGLLRDVRLASQTSPSGPP